MLAWAAWQLHYSLTAQNSLHNLLNNLPPQSPDLSHFIINCSTLLGVPSCVRFCQQEFGELPRLVGRYCSYLLPKQAGGTPQILVDKTSRMTGRLRVYKFIEKLSTY